MGNWQSMAQFHHNEVKYHLWLTVTKILLEQLVWALSGDCIALYGGNEDDLGCKTANSHCTGALLERHKLEFLISEIISMSKLQKASMVAYN